MRGTVIIPCRNGAAFPARNATQHHVPDADARRGDRGGRRRCRAPADRDGARALNSPTLDGGAWTATVPRGQRLYAIGDIHGRFDLFEALVAAIQSDNAGRPPSTVTLILLGNLVDRGPASAALMRRAHDWSRRSARLMVLKGSHEEMMVEALEGRLGLLSVWLAQGGDRTLESWGVPPDLLAEGAARKILDAARDVVPPSLIRWLKALPLDYTVGGYHFVHAGIRPGVSLNRQRPDDLLWIEGPFLDSFLRHPKLIVHGHSIAEGGPEIRANRIGLNTAGFRTGRLTALGLEGHDRWLLST